MFEGSDKIARWNQYLIAASGLLAMNYWIDRGVVKAAAKYTGPVGVGISAWYLTNWVGLNISTAVDPQSGADNWANYYVSPLSKISPGKDTILSNIADATMLHYDQGIAHKFTRSSSPGGPWFKTIMAAYGADVF